MSVGVSSSMSLYEPQSDDASERVRALNIPWEAYHRGKMITQEQFDLIREYDKADTYSVENLLDKNGQSYAKLFVDLLKTINKEETTQYLLTLIDDMLTRNSERTRLFHSRDSEAYPFPPLLKCLEREDEYTMQKANKLLTGIICSGGSISNDDFKRYLDWLISKLGSKSAVQMEASIQSLMNLLLIVDIRLKFADSDGLNKFIDILKSQPNFQVRYQTIFCLWLLSFTPEIAAKFSTKWKIIPLLIETVKTNIKEKVIRVSIATLRNMLEKAPQVNLQPLSDFKVLALCESLKNRKWTDEDIEGDLNYLFDTLKTNVKEMGTFAEYGAEVRSGLLEWSSSHKSDTFWKQNAHLLNENEHELLKILSRLLTVPDAKVVAIAASDIGEYVRVYPRGKRIVQQIGAKQQLMQLLSHQDADVRYQSLLAIQKFMVTNWEYLSKSTAQAQQNNS